MLIFLNYFLVLFWGNVCNSNVTMKFARLHCFLWQNVGGTKRYYVLSCPKVGGKCPPVPPIKSVPPPLYLNFSTCCNVMLLTCSIQYTPCVLGET